MQQFRRAVNTAAGAKARHQGYKGLRKPDAQRRVWARSSQEANFFQRLAKFFSNQRARGLFTFASIQMLPVVQATCSSTS